ncbi:Gmad2 immunoglobulin-like domain-containing protein [Candidatus Uhrbacteria bacterium]|nr:Gmad2 immunoglobulin-like domain-containing protein [Candidatus Uhrbacteria bacterium]
MTLRTPLLVAILPLVLLACRPQTVASFESCMAAGYPVTESVPRECRTPEGAMFTEQASSTGADVSNLIRVTSPTPDALIEGTVSIDGKARGTWFFEASFPILLLDDAGNQLAVAVAQAQDEWMTEDFVPFHAELTVPATTAITGMLVLEKDNPSGLPEHSNALRIPVRFR